MKKIILFLSLIFVPIMVVSKEISKNPYTDVGLYENCGIYSIKSNDGVLILGSRDDAKKFLKEVNGAFVTERLDHIYNFGGGKYEVKKYADGKQYIVIHCTGKIILSGDDAGLFAFVLGIEDGFKGAKRLGKNLSDMTGFTKIYKELTK